MNEELKNTINLLPETSGVYQYFNAENELIYVGKAKNLKRRVSSYFSKNHEDAKTRLLVKKIHSLKYIVVSTEEDALLLENSLIKQYQPRYNILLKDDKSYPWLRITKEHFPRLLYTRSLEKDGSFYFGPYPNIKVAKVLVEMIRELYPLRTCKLSLSPHEIEKGKYKVCLQYHIKRCEGACEGYVNEEHYNLYIECIRKILKGKSNEVREELYNEMLHLSNELRFEEAAEAKRKYDLLEKYQSKSVIVSPFITNIDIFSYTENEESAYINGLHVENGSIVQTHTIEYRKSIEEAKEDILSNAIVEIREQFESHTKEIIVPFQPTYKLNNVEYSIPIKGDKKQLLLLSQRNAEEYKLDKTRKKEALNPDQKSIRILTTLQKELHLHELPMHIECFDNSNLQGTNPVSSCVVFTKGKPNKKEYRHFHIKSLGEKPDDFASMMEVVGRRYSRMKEEGTPLPQLIIVDGGKGQLHSAFEILQSLGLGNIPIIGIAKRLEEIFFPNDSIPLYLDKNSESLKLIQHLRDEAHRFGITFHRSLRSKKQTSSILDTLKGVGEKTRATLLQHFKSVKRLKESSESEICSIMGEKRGKNIFSQLHKEEESNPQGA
ncbi:MAG TPA: excinuclease ABC subunit C [Porphyromonadaceae bacterium]|nr:excinuclease ABC subunit C [Porphyromonadaceae bacterium]